MMFITQTESADIVISTITSLVVRISKWIKNNEKKRNAVLESHAKLFISS